MGFSISAYDIISFNKNGVSWDEVIKSMKILKTVDWGPTIQVQEDE